MAFATSDVARDNAGSVAVMRGTWTGVVGDASGTVTGKGHVLSAQFDANTTNGPANPIRPTWTNSSGTWTVTIPYFETVTAGTFEIRFK